MARFVLVHGAWSGGWAWRKFGKLLQDRGHEVHRATLTGQGERAHLARPETDLDTHIRDVTALIDFEELRDIVLVGHSYGGMVVTGVADLMPERISRLVYIDAMLPEDGQCLLDLLPEDHRASMRARAAEGEGWRLAPNPVPPDTPAEERAWLEPRRLPQPFGTFTQPIRLEGAAPTMPRSYIYCLRSAPGDVFRQFADRVDGQPGWRRFDIDASHSPHITARDALADLLERIADQS
jgi:pimeloyl-ACP methyl ester carboxylesterase